MSASDRFQNPTKRVNEIWQTDFTYFKIVGWGWYYLATVLDDFSRYIIAWKLFKTMATEDVKVVLDLAVAATGVDQVKVKHRPTAAHSRAGDPTPQALRRGESDCLRANFFRQDLRPSNSPQSIKAAASEDGLSCAFEGAGGGEV